MADHIELSKAEVRLILPLLEDSAWEWVGTDGPHHQLLRRLQEFGYVDGLPKPQDNGLRIVTRDPNGN